MNCHDFAPSFWRCLRGISVLIVQKVVIVYYAKGGDVYGPVSRSISGKDDRDPCVCQARSQAKNVGRLECALI